MFKPVVIVMLRANAATGNFERRPFFQQDKIAVESYNETSPDLEFHENIRLLIYRPRGSLNEASLNKVLNALEDLETKLKEPFNRFSDTTAADEIELNFKYVIQFSLHRRLSYAGRPPVKSAILATDSTMIHFGRLHALLTQGSPIKVCIFTDRKEAAQWLKVPIDRLSAEAKGSSLQRSIMISTAADASSATG